MMNKSEILMLRSCIYGGSHDYIIRMYKRLYGVPKEWEDLKCKSYISQILINYLEEYNFKYNLSNMLANISPNSALCNVNKSLDETYEYVFTEVMFTELINITRRQGITYLKKFGFIPRKHRRKNLNK